MAWIRFERDKTVETKGYMGISVNNNQIYITKAMGERMINKTGDRLERLRFNVWFDKKTKAIMFELKEDGGFKSSFNNISCSIGKIMPKGRYLCKTFSDRQIIFIKQ